MTSNNHPEPTSSQEIRSANEDYCREGFQELETRLEKLMNMLGDVLGDDRVLGTSIPWRDKEISAQSDEPKDIALVAQLQAICFEILNMVEERTSRMIRHRRRNELGSEAEEGLWGLSLIHI